MKFFIIITILSTPAALSFRLKENELKTCICPMVYQPVCGSNAQTYTNDCFFSCAQATEPGLTIHSQGECAEPVDTVPEGEQYSSDEQENDKGCICSMDYKPVCGTDRETYGNICFFNCARKENPALGFLSEGECPSERVALVDAPVPQMKPTPFRARRTSLKKTSDNMTCPCTREYRPICGTDGVNRVEYPNPCLLKCAQQSNPELTILKEGRCEDV